PELVEARVALVDVEALVLAEGNGDALGVDRAAEELHAVIRVGDDLDVLDGGAAADAAEGQAVDLVVRRELEPAEAERDVAQDAAVVRVVGAAIGDEAGVAAAGETLDAGLALVGGTGVVVHLRVAEQ